MDVEILGCSGGIGPGQATTCLRIDGHTLIDAGSGLGSLSGEELSRIRRVFITHAHLDHVLYLPLLLDFFIEQQRRAVEVFVLPQVLLDLRAHLFNGVLWPDFSVLPNRDRPILALREIAYWQPLESGGLTITPFPVDHGVPACGFRVADGRATLAITGDTGYSPELMTSLRRLGPLDVLMTECAFPDRLDDLARSARHLTPLLLVRLLNELHQSPYLWISHLKPTQAEEIAAELRRHLPVDRFHLLRNGERLSCR